MNSGPALTFTRRTVRHALPCGVIALACGVLAVAPAWAGTGPSASVITPDSRIGVFQAGAPQPPDSALVDPKIVPNTYGGWMNRGFSPNSATVDIDNWVRWAEAMGMDPIITLQSTAAGDSISSPPADTTAWKDWVTSVVERYDDDGTDDMPGLTAPVRHWHVEQEWHLWWSGTVEEYVAHLAMTYATVHRADPLAKVILIGLATQTVTAGAVCLQSVSSGDTCTVGGKALEETTQLLQQGRYDIVDMHSYESWPIIAAKIEWIRDTMPNPQLPIWSLEAGGPYGIDGEPYSDATNSAAVVQQFAQALGNGVERYGWALFPPAPGTTFDYAPWTDMPLSAWVPYPDSLALKPAYYTYRLMVRLLSGFSSASNVSTGSATDTLGAFMYRFQLGDSTVYVVWNSDGIERDVTFDIQGPAAIVTHIISEPGQTDDDAQMEFLYATHGNVIYTATPSPVFIKFVEAITDAPPLARPPDTALPFTLTLRGATSRGDVHFELRGALGARPPLAQVFDARGRVVRDVSAALRPVHDARGDGFDGAWDGRDAAGAPSAAGVYFLAVTPRDAPRGRPAIARLVRLAH